MSLPGTSGQRISDLCNGNYIIQKQFAKKIGVSASQLNYIISGETRTVGSDILIGVAKEFKVSTDYILGLSTVSVRKSYGISELGLSGGAVTAAMFQTMQENMKDYQQDPLSIDDITARIAGQIGQLLPMDEETAEQFRQLEEEMIKQAEKG